MIITAIVTDSVKIQKTVKFEVPDCLKDQVLAELKEGNTELYAAVFEEELWETAREAARKDLRNGWKVTDSDSHDIEFDVSDAELVALGIYVETDDAEPATPTGKAEVQVN